MKMQLVTLDRQLDNRNERASPHFYRSALARSTAGNRIRSDLVDMVFDEAAVSLELQALASLAATREEIDEVLRMPGQLKANKS